MGFFGDGFISASNQPYEYGRGYGGFSNAAERGEGNFGLGVSPFTGHGTNFEDGADSYYQAQGTYDFGSSGANAHANSEALGGQFEHNSSNRFSDASNWNRNSGQENLNAFNSDRCYPNHHATPEGSSAASPLFSTADHVTEGEIRGFLDSHATDSTHSPASTAETHGDLSRLGNPQEGTVRSGQPFSTDRPDGNNLPPPDRSGHDRLDPFGPSQDIDPNVRPSATPSSPPTLLDDLQKAIPHGPDVLYTIHEKILEPIKLGQDLAEIEELSKNMAGSLIGGRDLYEDLSKHTDLVGKLAPVTFGFELGLNISEYAQAWQQGDVDRLARIPADTLLNVTGFFLSEVSIPLSLLYTGISAYVAVREITETSHEKKGNKE